MKWVITLYLSMPDVYHSMTFDKINYKLIPHHTIFGFLCRYTLSVLLAESQGAYVMAQCMSCVFLYISLSVNYYFKYIFFSETTLPISMKFVRNVPAMVLFRSS